MRIRQLRLVGGLRSYGVSFLDSDGHVRPLSVIAGEISTGKTSVLEFITYCLGDREFPTHEEIRRSVRTALLEVEFAGVTYVIERPCVERPSTSAIVHSCSIETLEDAHRSVEVATGGTDEGTLSYLILQQLGIGEVRLKEAPTRSGSEVDRLSIRDILRLVYVRYRDLGTDSLLRENRPPVVRLKYEQTIDVLFDAHDNRASSIAAEIKRLGADIDAGQRELDTVLSFLKEQQIPSPDVLAGRAEMLEQQLESSREQLGQIEEQMLAVSEFGAQQRAAHQAAAEEARSASNERRSTLLQIERLTALAAQYDQDVKKLRFASQADTLFDPLLVNVCPWCFQQVDAEAESGTCGVCHQVLDPEEEDDRTFDVEKELQAIIRRQRELSKSLDELHREAGEAEARVESSVRRARESQEALDRVMQSRFAPFIDQRDALTSTIARASQEREGLERMLLMHDAGERRRSELGSLRQQMSELEAELAGSEGASSTRSEVVEALTSRYSAILEDFQFPKLSNAYLDERYVPHARGQAYNQLGSAGAGTLVTLAWYLSIFEEVAERDGPHPGVLLVDSPQKGLRATADEPDDEFHSPSIAASVYRHLVEWADSEWGQETQLIVVDNAPQQIADDSDIVVVRFTGKADEPPYGLIEDATS